jgi:hypothetical protein
MPDHQRGFDLADVAVSEVTKLTAFSARLGKVPQGTESAQAESDPRLAEIVRRHFHPHTVTNGEADEMLAHLAGNVGQHFVLIVQRDAKHGSWKDCFDHTFQLNRLFTTHTYFWLRGKNVGCAAKK